MQYEFLTELSSLVPRCMRSGNEARTALKKYCAPYPTHVQMTAIQYCS